jgi:hypothetical protein
MVGRPVFFKDAFLDGLKFFTRPEQSNPAAGFVVIPRCPPGPGVPDNPE